MIVFQSRLHGSGSYRVPWNYGDEAVKATSKMTKTKLRLMPYIYAQVCHFTPILLLLLLVIRLLFCPLLTPSSDPSFSKYLGKASSSWE